MNKVQEFLNEQFGEVRVIVLNNEPHFIAKDVCGILDLKNTTVALNGLKEMTHKVLLQGVECTKLNLGHFPDGLNLLTEAGLYKLVFKSRKPEAEKFEDWITGTVIPAIRKDDGYVDGEEDFAKGELSEAEFILKAMNMLQNKVERLEKENEEMKPKVNKWEKFLNSDGTYSFTQVSKLLSTMAQEEKSDINISVVKLTEFLRQQDILSRQKSPDKIKDGKVKKGTYKNLPNKEYEDYFNVASVSVTDKFSTTQTTVKSSGVELIYNLVKEKYSA
jgi:prophage antirepressor-like protein